MVGGVVMVVVAYFWGAPALVTATAVAALMTMLWLLRRGIDGYVQNATASVFSLIYVPFLGSFVALLLSEGGGVNASGLDDPGVQGIITFIAITVASDTGGYVAGVLFGKHPMAPVISPKKSWEGFAGSFVFCLIAGWALVVYLLDGDWWVGLLLGPGHRRDGHPGRPLRVGHQARPRHQGHEPGDPRSRRPDGPPRLAAGHHRADLADPALPGLLGPGVTLFLVRHERPVIDPTTPAASWPLDPAGFDDVWALRDRLPQGAVWFTSPEPKALEDLPSC